MKTTVKNQHDRYIYGDERVEKIKHMAEHGFGSIEIDNQKVSLKDIHQDEEEMTIIVEVEGI
jgi:hypothetical protein